MPEWLTSTVTSTSVSPKELAIRLAVSLVLGAVVAAIYRVSHGRGKEDASALATTLVLLCVLTAMVSVVIGDNVARAFGLVGALSIVRFRTVVDDTRDTAFVICAVIVGMAIGAGVILLPLMGLPVVALAAVVMDRISSRAKPDAIPESTLNIRLGLGRSPEDALGGTLSRHLTDIRLASASTARQGAALDITYQGRLRNATSLTALVSELNQIEGVQSVELKQP